jgi:hypothetical protein
MGISHPTKNVYSITDTHTSGVNTYTFKIPQDTNSIVVRCYSSTFTGTSPTCDVYVQTTEDEGTTWRDCAHFKQITGAGTIAQAEFAPIAVMGSSPGRITGNAANGWIGSVQASMLGASQLSGLPLLSTHARLTFKYGGTQLATGGVKVDVFATGQDSAI